MAKQENKGKPRVVGTSAIDVAVRHQIYLERLASDLSSRVREKAGKFSEAVVDWLGGLEGELAEMPVADAMASIAAAVPEQTQILVDAMVELTSQLPEVSSYEVDFELRALEKQVRNVKLRAARGRAAFQRAMSEPIPATGNLLEDFVKEWSEKEVKAVGEAIAKGFSSGMTNDEIARAIRGTKAKNYRDGIAPSIGKNADAVVRTSVQHVANTARQEVWDRNSDIVTGYQIVAVLDGNTTTRCRSLDGQIFPLGKGPRPPFHVRCRTTTVAVVSPEFAFLDEGATRSSMEGQVDADETYYSWLKSQPVAFQDSVLGKARGKLFRDGGLTSDEFARLNLDRNFEPLTLEEMRRLEPLAFERANV